MSIIRRKVNQNYTVVPNEPVVDDRLSYDALGLLTYLLSRPDNWSVNLNQLRYRGGVGRDKIQRVMRSLIDAGYVTRERRRDGDNQQFGSEVYTVYDCPQLARLEPQPDFQAVAPECDIPAATVFSVAGKPVAGKQGCIVSTDYNNSLRENSASDEAGAVAPKEAGEKGKRETSNQPQPPAASPTVTKLIWDEGKALLSQGQWGMITKWLKAIEKSTGEKPVSDETKEKFLGIIRAATRQGTPYPHEYIAGGVREQWPPPPDPKDFPHDKWARIGALILEGHEWQSSLGPSPGQKGCLMPADLVTDQLIGAVQNANNRKAA